MAEAKKSTKVKEVKEAELVVEAAPAKKPAAEKPKKAATAKAPAKAGKPADSPSVAKAGKRSAKAVAETEEKEVKKAKKVATKTEKEAEKAKPVVKAARSREERAGKKYREVAKLVDKSKAYSLAEAIDLATKTSTTKFDATVEMHIRLGVDPTQADQNVRDTVVLPAGTGKSLRIAVLAEADDAAKAKTAGAQVAGLDDILADLEKEKVDFDVLITTPSLMPRLAKYARMLGPKGLMPNPKSGTVTSDVAAAVKQAAAGRVEYRVDQAGIIHLPIGKVSFGPAKLATNAEAVLSSVKAAKPASLKGIYIQSMFVTTSMGPGIRVQA